MTWVGYLIPIFFFYLRNSPLLLGETTKGEVSVWQQVWAGKYVTFQLRLLTRLYLRHYSEFEIISITDPSSFFLMIELTWQKREDALFRFSRLLITSSRNSIPLVVQVKIEVQNGDFSSRGRAHPQPPEASPARLPQADGDKHSSFTDQNVHDTSFFICFQDGFSVVLEPDLEFTL